MEQTFFLLRKIGLRSTYSGYNYLAYAITLARDNEQYLHQVTKNLYIVIGEKYGVSSHSVEAALRTLIINYWKRNRDSVLSKMLGYRLLEKPTSSEFISILSDYLRDHPDFGQY